MSREGRSHQGLMQGRAHLPDRVRELLGDAGVCLAVLFKTGDPMPETDNLGSNGWEGYVMRKTVTPADMCIGRPT